MKDHHSHKASRWYKKPLQLSRSAKAKTAESALEYALINLFGCLGRVPQTFKLRSDNGLKQEFITLHTPQQNGMVERLIRAVKE